MDNLENFRLSTAADQQGSAAGVNCRGQGPHFAKLEGAMPRASPRPLQQLQDWRRLSAPGQRKLKPGYQGLGLAPRHVYVFAGPEPPQAQRGQPVPAVQVSAGERDLF